MNRLPADSCLRCDRTLKLVGGHRLVRTPTTSVQIIRETEMNTLRECWFAIDLNGDHAGWCVVFTGAGWRDKAVLRRAEAQANAGRIPWLCQPCAGRACGVCGAPLSVPAASTVLHDDGSEGNMPTMPYGGLGCTNHGCPNHAVTE